MGPKGINHEESLELLGSCWREAREAERAAAAAVYEAIRDASAAGVTQVDIAALAGVDRMTVRRALGLR